MQKNNILMVSKYTKKKSEKINWRGQDQKAEKHIEMVF